MYKSFNLFGIKFISSDYNSIITRLNKGSFMVVPAAPALATINEDKKYYEALLNSDFAIPDSGYMVLLINLFKKMKIKKLSGYAFIQKFIREKVLRKENCLFLIDPSKKDININNEFLHNNDILIDIENHYCAPFYNREKIIDPILLEILEQKRPKYILVNLGGGVQERLGSYLKNNLSYAPGIICTGAAISFLTGRQARIPNIIDRLYLGWLWRIFNKPTIFIPRYLKGIKLAIMLLKKGSVT